jgi:hypothetical protein
MYDPIAAITASSLVAGAELGTMIEAAPENPSPAGGVFIDFDIRRDLGRAGTRTLDRAAALAMHAVGSLPGFTAESPEPDPFMGLVMASTMGSIQSTMDFTRDSFTGTKPYHVDPARFEHRHELRCRAVRHPVWHSGSKRHGDHGPRGLAQRLGVRLPPIAWWSCQAHGRGSQRRTLRSTSSPRKRRRHPG